MRFRHAIALAALAPCATLALPSPLPAQYQPPPGPQASPSLPAMRTQVSTYQGQPAQPQGFAPGLPAPPPPYSPYGNYAVDPYGGYMSGAASVINAQANFTQARQEAAI